MFIIPLLLHPTDLRGVCAVIPSSRQQSGLLARNIYLSVDGGGGTWKVRSANK